MNYMTLLSLPLWIAGVTVVHYAAITTVQRLLLAVYPMTHTASEKIYIRSMFTFSHGEVLVLWVLLICSSAMWWAWLSLDTQAMSGPAIVTFAVAALWELWTWDRVAINSNYISWRHGWRQNVRRVHLKSVRDIRIIESQDVPRWGRWLNSARLVVVLRNGKTARLPRTSASLCLRDIEDVAIFLQSHLEDLKQMRQHLAREAAAAKKAFSASSSGKKNHLSIEEHELRKRIAALRRAKAEQAAKNS
jgi:hypothetical protein